MKINSENIYYVKRNSRYVPRGVSFPRDMLGEGLWYVRVIPGMKSISNVETLGEVMRLNDNPIVGNATEICKLDDLASRVMEDEDFKERFLSYGSSYSINDIVHATVGILKKIAENEKTKD